MRKVLIDIKRDNPTIDEALESIERFRAEYPGREIFMDGDLYAIVVEV